MKLDLLAIGAHPDDIELSCAGILMIEKMGGKNVGIIDLTRGELGTRGTPETREQEAKNAAQILRVDVRENLGLADGFFENNRPNQIAVINAIRKHKPEIILCNAPADRHPDHGRAAQLVRDAAFLSGLRKIETTDVLTGILQAAWKPKLVLHYIQDHYLKPNFVYDITPVMDKKIEAIKAYTTQFNTIDKSEPETYISKPDFLDSIIYRAKMFGKMIGVAYAEGLISDKMMGIQTFDALVQQIT